MTNAIMLYVELDGQIWAIMEDGTWLGLEGPLPSEIEVPFVQNLEDILTHNKAGDLTFSFENKTIVVDQSQLDAAPTFNHSGYTPTQSAPPAIEENGGGLGVTTRLESDGAETIAEAGYQTSGTTSSDEIEAADDDQQAPRLDKDAMISIVIEDGDDAAINQFEVNTTLIHGTTELVDDDRVVLVTVTDFLGNTLDFATTVTDSTWTLGEIDLGPLEQGTIVADAVITDFYGNSISAETDSLIDTLAEITLALEGNGDDWLNAFEVSSTGGQGSITNVENGQLVTIIATDNAGNTVSTSATVTDGKYAFTDLDLRVKLSPAKRLKILLSFLPKMHKSGLLSKV